MDALLAQRERLKFICDKNSDLVKKCNGSRYLRYQPVDEEERSFLKDELTWLLHSVSSQEADKYRKVYRSIKKRITKGHLGNFWVREQEWAVENPGDQAEQLVGAKRPREEESGNDKDDDSQMGEASKRQKM